MIFFRISKLYEKLCPTTYPVNIYLFKVNGRNTKKGVEYLQS